MAYGQEYIYFNGGKRGKDEEGDPGEGGGLCNSPSVKGFTPVLRGEAVLVIDQYGTRIFIIYYRSERSSTMAQDVSTRIMSRTLHRVDLFLMGLTGGKVSVPGTLGGLPVVRLTTIGAKTGRERTVPLLGIEDGEKWVLIASNWGNERHPSWYYNLRANPEVRLSRNDRTKQYTAREATEEERPKYWAQAKELYPNYESYQQYTDGRQIPIVVLTPTER